MSMFPNPETHAANGPDTWQTVKVGDRAWEVQSKDGQALTRCTRKIDADTVRTEPSSWLRAGYEKEGRWYAGGTIPGWKSWAECEAEQDKIAARALARALAVA